MNPLNLKWHSANNGRQIDIYARDPGEDRNVTIACNVREDCANVLAAAASLLFALQDAELALKRALSLEEANHGMTAHAHAYSQALKLADIALGEAGRPKSEERRVNDFKTEFGVSSSSS